MEATHSAFRSQDFLATGHYSLTPPVCANDTEPYSKTLCAEDQAMSFSYIVYIKTTM